MKKMGTTFSIEMLGLGKWVGIRNIKYCTPRRCEQSGAAEACWAHNPEVDGSKPSSAIGTNFALLFSLEQNFDS